MTQEEIDKRICILNSPAQHNEQLIMENSTQFEHKITYIGAGAIAAILIFADKHLYYSWLLIIGLAILLISCMINLWSYVWYNNILEKEYCMFREISYGLKSINDTGISKNYYNKYKRIIDLPESEFHTFIVATIQKRNKKSQIYNFVNIIFLMIGLCVISLYVALNLCH